jgi:hypothetical protein
MEIYETSQHSIQSANFMQCCQLAVIRVVIKFEDDVLHSSGYCFIKRQHRILVNCSKISEFKLHFQDLKCVLAHISWVALNYLFQADIRWLGKYILFAARQAFFSYPHSDFFHYWQSLLDEANYETIWYGCIATNRKHTWSAMGSS